MGLLQAISSAKLAYKFAALREGLLGIGIGIFPDSDPDADREGFDESIKDLKPSKSLALDSIYFGIDPPERSDTILVDQLHKIGRIGDEVFQVFGLDTK